MHLLALILTILELGPHLVGTRIEGAHATWYPAQSGGEIVRFRDYVPRLDDADALLHSRNVADETIVSLFDSRMAARRDATPKRGRFPAVVIEGRTAADCAVLAELIASHGFVVTTSRTALGRDGKAIRLEDELTTWSLVASKTTRPSAQRAAEHLLHSLGERR